MSSMIRQDENELGKTIIQQNTEDYESLEKEMIEASMKKSYIYEMAGKKKRIFKEDSSSLGSSIIGSKGRKRINFQNVSKIQEEVSDQQQSAEFMVSNIGSKNNSNLDCCGGNGAVATNIELTNTKQMYIYHLGTKILIYSLNFNTIDVSLNSMIESQGFFIITVNQFLIIKIQNKQKKKLVKKVYRSIKDMASESLGQKYRMEDLKHIEDYQSNKYKSALQFMEHGQTGDILLFKSSHIFAKFQRFFTSSEYDHVAMVIRDPVYGLLIFQSNSSSGVCLTPWQFVIKLKWYESIDRIVWRKLTNVDRGYIFSDLIHRFVVANIGKQYYISINKLISTKSFLAQSPEETGFFCSELVATVYKDLSLLTRDTEDPSYKPSSSFIPFHFTQKHDLKLEKGCLSDEYILHFHDEALYWELKS